MAANNVGDGTNWSSERGSTRDTGIQWGGGRNSGGNSGGGNSGGGNKNNARSREGDIAINIQFVKPGETTTTPWGTVTVNAQGYSMMNGIVMTPANSSLQFNGPYEIVRVLNSLLRPDQRTGGVSNGNVNLGNGAGIFTPIPGHINVADTGRYLEPNFGGHEFYSRVGDNIYSVKVLNEKQDLSPVLVLGEHARNTKIRREQTNQSENNVRAYLNEVNDSVRFAADFFKEVFNKFGANSSAIAEELANAAKGKQIKSFDEAMAAYNKYGSAIHSKFSVADREAIVRALESVDRNLVASNLSKFSRAFGAVGITIDSAALSTELYKGIRTGDYSSFYLKAETITFGLAASAILAFTFAALAATPLGILAFGLLLAITSALIDEALMQRINNTIFN